MTGGCVLYSNSCVDILPLSVKVLGGAAFGRWLGHKGGALSEAVSTLVKGLQRTPLFSFHHVKIH